MCHDPAHKTLHFGDPEVCNPGIGIPGLSKSESSATFIIASIAHETFGPLKYHPKFYQGPAANGERQHECCSTSSFT